MRRSLALLFFLALAIVSAAGQDIILTRTAEEIKAKVIAITDEAITYQLQGQTVNRVMPLTDIFMIKYANGEKEVFNTNERITSNTRTTDKPRASRSYQLLDLYDENGVRGIVVDVYDDGYRWACIIAIMVWKTRKNSSPICLKANYSQSKIFQP